MLSTTSNGPTDKKLQVKNIVQWYRMDNYWK